MVRTAQFSRWDAEVKQRAWERFLSVQQCEGVSVWQLEAGMYYSQVMAYLNLRNDFRNERIPLGAPRRIVATLHRQVL